MSGRRIDCGIVCLAFGRFHVYNTEVDVTLRGFAFMVRLCLLGLCLWLCALSCVAAVPCACVRCVQCGGECRAGKNEDTIPGPFAFRFISALYFLLHKAVHSRIHIHHISPYRN